MALKNGLSGGIFSRGFQKSSPPTQEGATIQICRARVCGVLEVLLADALTVFKSPVING
jgi:hypothetical protein